MFEIVCIACVACVALLIVGLAYWRHQRPQKLLRALSKMQLDRAEALVFELMVYRIPERSSPPAADGPRPYREWRTGDLIVELISEASTIRARLFDFNKRFGDLTVRITTRWSRDLSSPEQLVQRDVVERWSRLNHILACVPRAHDGSNRPSGFGRRGMVR